ncbi:DUF397 domain-containing protein [Saccharopolyspora phatthalungensis]|uniref:DUF397 domain-containing protein n=1 Tax=Saccharopolyspora phatthalungensis TaxID=664693 RepID=A0A840QDT7_9PSEU|nr:DUF397 domain-containing protein [Saccharopolyspora phatthalungensis]MBB5156729.1 hypothetical protein [Saccharopolyspora phatthalungensis]
MSTTPEWRKSSRSGQGNNCVEVATNQPGTALVRDSKLGEASPILSTTPQSFAAFIDAVKSDRF